jgi:hypothetical protein
MIIVVILLAALCLYLSYKLTILKDASDTFAQIVIKSTFVKYNGIVYHKNDYHEGKCILLAGQSAYVEILPVDTKWQYATAEEFLISENNLRTKQLCQQVTQVKQ